MIIISRDVSITNLRVLASFAVVFLHASATWVLKSSEIGETTWFVANVFDSAMRWCVPIFFMVSGALLLRKTETIKEFYQKRLNKILIPFLFWTGFYSLINFYVKGHPISEVIKRIPNQAEGHLWFLYALISIYVITPFVRKLVQQISKKEYEWLLCIWFISSIIFPTLERFFSITIQFEFPLITNYLGYFILGHYLYTFKPKISIIWFYLGLFITVFATYYFSLENMLFDKFFYEYLSINVWLMSVSLFSFFQRHPVSIPTFRFFDRVNFGVYLVHLYVLDVLGRRLGVHVLMGHPLWTIPLVSVLTILISAFIVVIFSKMPILKKTV